MWKRRSGKRNKKIGTAVNAASQRNISACHRFDSPVPRPSRQGGLRHDRGLERKGIYLMCWDQTVPLRALYLFIGDNSIRLNYSGKEVSMKKIMWHLKKDLILPKLGLKLW
jgi:hypothetical protein